MLPALLRRPEVGIGMASGLGLLKNAGQAAPPGGDCAPDARDDLDESCGVSRLDEGKVEEYAVPLYERAQARGRGASNDALSLMRAPCTLTLAGGEGLRDLFALEAERGGEPQD